METSGLGGTNASPVELPASSGSGGSPNHSQPRGGSGGSDIYYEDADPRFVSEPDPPPLPRDPVLPPSRAPGPNANAQVPQIGQTASYEELQQDLRSPVESEASHFTSVSQRPVNPLFLPGGPGDAGTYPLVIRKAAQQRRDMILEGNPDFELPNARPGRGRGGTTRLVGGRVPPPVPALIGQGSRYPGGDI